MPIHGYPGNVITANPTAPTSSVATGVWTTEQQLIAKAAGNWPMGLTQISRSLRFNSADSAYLNRTPGSAGNRKTWTWNGWVKRSGSGSRLFCSGDQGVSLLRSFLLFGDNISFIDVNASNTTLAYADSVAVFRDYSAWYCVTLVIDTTQATGSNRVKLYVNGVQQTLTFSTTPSQNADLAMNAASRMTLGTAYDTSSFLDCYLTEVNFIDGLALDPSYFGFNNSDTGVWSPKQYTGTYGTNGFYLNFSDNSGTTSTTLGKDYSGNGNNFTPNNFSVTAGVGNDSMVDSPTSYGTDTGAGGEVRGNYCTWNPLDVGSSNMVSSNGNLVFTKSSATFSPTRGTLAVTSGKYYFEMLANNSNLIQIGVSNGYNIRQSSGDNSISSSGGIGAAWDSRGFLYQTSSSGSYAYTFTTNDVVMVAFDADSGKIWFGKNGTWNTGSPSAGTSPAFTASGYDFLTPFGNGESGGSGTANFGQRPFAYTAPSGFKALCTQNLPTPTIGATSTTQANKYMDVTLYTGNATARSLTNSGSMQPDFVWDKLRSGANSHRLFDAVRGVEKALYSNLTNSETTETGTLTAFNSNGFSLGTNNETNTNGSTYVAWQWSAGGSTVTNTSGTISAQVRASTTAGFSIATYTGNGSAGATVGHGLGVTPSMIFVKSRSVGTAGWVVWHTSLTLGANSYLVLEGTQAQQTTNQPWNNTLPTSSVFSLRTWDAVNQNGSTYVAYLFAAVAGYSAFGSYTGNGSADGPFIYTGFKPNFVMVKQTNTSGNSWWMFDGVRSPTNAVYNRLAANLSDAEYSNSSTFDFLSNGFKLRFSDTAWNGSGSTYIYAAFAESPFKYALAR